MVANYVSAKKMYFFPKIIKNKVKNKVKKNSQVVQMVANDLLLSKMQLVVNQLSARQVNFLKTKPIKTKKQNI